MNCSNTHASIFTRIPSGVTKIWLPKLIRPDGSAPEFGMAGKHTHCPVATISLSVRFDHRVVSPGSATYDAYDDTSQDHIAMWKSQQQFWAQLEASVQRCVTEYATAQQKSADACGSRTLEVPLLTRTEVIVQPPNAPSVRDLPLPPRSAISARTVHTLEPADSASRLDTDDVTERVGRMSVRSPRTKRKHRSKQRSKSRARSILNYART